MMAEMVMSVSQYQEEEEDEEEEEEPGTEERDNNKQQQQQQQKEGTLLDDDETPAAVLARYAAAGPADEEADDALLVREKIRLLQEENVRLRQTLGKTVGGKGGGQEEATPAAPPKEEESLGLVGDWLVGAAKASEERERAHVEATTAARQDRERDRALSAAKQQLASERAERTRLLAELDRWVATSKGSGATKKSGRAAPLPNYGQLALTKKSSVISEGAAQILSDLEMRFAPAKAKASAPRVDPVEEAADRALHEALADIEHALAASATTIARHTAGGVAMPLVIRVSNYFKRVPIPIRRAAMAAMLVLFIVLVMLNFLYDAEDQIDAVLEEEGVVFDKQMLSIEEEVLTTLASAGATASGEDARAIEEMVEDALTFDGYGGDESDTDILARRRRSRRLLLGAGGAVLRGWLR